MATSLPARADVVIVGGGIVGCSVAYHLTKLGITDVVLLERQPAHLRHDLARRRPGRPAARHAAHDRARQVHRRAAARAGGRDRAGHRLQAERLDQHRAERRALRGAQARRLDGQELRPRGRGDRPPPRSRPAGRCSRRATCVGGIFLPKDGQANPVDVTQAFAKGARRRGARIVEGVKVERILVEQGRAAGVMTGQGSVAAETVVLCAGMWSRELAAAIGVAVPLHAAEHFYVVTEPMAELPARPAGAARSPTNAPTTRRTPASSWSAPSSRVAKPWGMDGIPEDFAFGTPARRPRPFRAAARGRDAPRAGPGRGRASGPSSTARKASPPTTATCWARPPRCRTCSSPPASTPSASSPPAAPARCWRTGSVTAASADGPHGTSTSAGCMPFQSNRAYLRDRTTETLGLLYAMHWPYPAVRDRARRPPVAVSRPARRRWAPAWARPRAGSGQLVRAARRRAATTSTPTAGRTGSTPPPPSAGRVREAVGPVRPVVASPSSWWRAPMRCAVLNRICAAEIDVPVGRVVYTQWLQRPRRHRGRPHRHAPGRDRFLVVTAAAVADPRPRLADARTSRRMRAAAWSTSPPACPCWPDGPERARAAGAASAARTCPTPAFPFGTSREIDLGYARVRASRITYVGELG